MLALSGGAAAGYVAASGLHWIPTKAEMEAWRQGKEAGEAIRAQVAIDLPALMALLEQGVIVVDARSREDFERGHLFIDTPPPVLNVPWNSIDATKSTA
jgi:hypothetical protein